MPILTVLLVLAAVGVLVWALKLIPWIDPSMKQVITMVAIVAVVLWLASLFGLFGHLNAVKVGR